MRCKKLFFLASAIACFIVAEAASASPGVVTRVSVSSAGEQGNGWSGDPAISADGRFVAFQSLATNLVEGTIAICTHWSPVVGNCQGIFVHDRQTGETELVSLSSAGNQANGWSYGADISGDGRFVSFISGASDLVFGDTNVGHFPNGTPFGMDDVFVRDRRTGETTRVSVSSDGAQGDGPSDQAAISDDGRYVAFLSYATNLVPGDSNGQRDVFRHDRVTGETVRVNVSNSSAEANGSSSYHVTISADGGIVGFSSNASNLVNPAEAEMDIDAFLWDASTGLVELISTPSGMEAPGPYGEAPFVSAEGRWAVFSSGFPNLVPGDTNGIEDVFLRDRMTGQTRRISLTTDARELDSASFVMGITPDGRFAVYRSSAAGIVPDDTNDREDVFVWDRTTGETIRVSVDSAGNQGNDHSEFADISASGAVVAFESGATNLVPGDSNGQADVFVNERLVAPLQTATPSPPTATPLPATVVPPPTGEGSSDAASGIPTHLVLPALVGLWAAIAGALFLKKAWATR